MGLLDSFDGLGEFLKTPEGIGLLSGVAGYAANAQRGTPINNLGRGVMTGVMGYGQAQKQAEDSLNNGLHRQYQQTQMASAQAKMLEAQRRQQQIQSYRDSLPEQDRGLFDVAPDKYIENMPQFQKQQLVEVADPQDPLRTVKQWMRPGETNGTIAGRGTMPEILDPRVQEAKKAIAAAGRPNVETKIFNTAETEQAKVWGKTLGELRSNLANNAFTAPSKLSQLDRMEQLLQGVEGGKLAPLGAEIASAANSIGIKLDKNLGNKQAAEALSREIAGSFRQPGTGPMTDKDFENFLKRVPDLSKTAEGRNQIFKTMRSALKRDIEANKIVSSYAKRRNGNIDDGVTDELANFYASNPVVEQQPAQGGGFKIIGVR